jgi:hypothetical protein
MGEQTQIVDAFSARDLYGLHVLSPNQAFVAGLRERSKETDA